MTRSASINRNTKETKINCKLTIDGKGKAQVDTGVGFLDHMLDLFCFHGGFDLDLTCKGDLEVCPHHSIEDIALVLGSTFNSALNERKGINRYCTFYLPMDECLTRTSVDVSGRAYHCFRGEIVGSSIGSFPVEMVKHFFHSFSIEAKITLHQEILYGENNHHVVESLFKGFARSLADAVSVTSEKIPSSKGIL